MLRLDKVSLGFAQQKDSKKKGKFFSTLLSKSPQTSLLVLDKLSLQIQSNQIVALVGPSGIGKTSLLRLILGLEPLLSGCIYLDEELIQTSASSTVSSDTRNQDDISIHLPPNKRPFVYCSQESLLFPHLNVKDNITFGLTTFDDDHRTRLRWLLELLELESLMNRWPKQLSGGQQKRVALARSLVRPAKLVLLDEPFSSLDFKLSKYIQTKLFAYLKSEKKAVVWSTHHVESALNYADQVWYLEDPHTLHIGSPYHMLHHSPSRHCAEFFGAVSWIPVSLFKDQTPSTYTFFTADQKKAESLGFRPYFWQLSNEYVDTSTKYCLTWEAQVKEVHHCMTHQEVLISLKTEQNQVSSLHNIPQIRINLPHLPQITSGQSIKVSYTVSPLILAKAKEKE